MRSSIRRFFERLDDRRARALRRDLGGRGWLVSWHRTDGGRATPGPWLARVSCREWPPTVEAIGRSRVRAAAKAIGALTAALDARSRATPSAPHHGD